jgi:hypothetical protein
MLDGDSAQQVSHELSEALQNMIDTVNVIIAAHPEPKMTAAPSITKSSIELVEKIPPPYSAQAADVKPTALFTDLLDCDETVVLRNYDLKVPRSHFATHMGAGSEHCRFSKQAKQKRKYHRRKLNKQIAFTKFGEELQFDFYLPGRKLDTAIGGIKAALHLKDQGSGTADLLECLTAPRSPLKQPFASSLGFRSLNWTTVVRTTVLS